MYKYPIEHRWWWLHYYLMALHLQFISSQQAIAPKWQKCHANFWLLILSIWLLQDDIETIGLLYDSFLSKFPLCYGYWRRYVAEVARLCPIDKVIEVFEQAVESATYSVDMWVDYCSFGMLAFEDAYDVRR